MSLLRITLCAAFMLTVVLSKPVSQSEAENSSAESSETNSSEEAPVHEEQPTEPIQSASKDLVVPVSVEETEPPGTEETLPSVDANPSPATLSTSALPDLMHPQSSTDTDTMQPMTHDLSQTTVSSNIQNSTDVQPDSELSSNTTFTETHLTNQLHVTTTAATDQGLTPDATTPFSPHTIKPSPPSSSTAPPISVPIRASMTAVPVCFTLQFSTSEPEPARGDSM